MSMQRLQRLVELDEHRADLEKQLSDVVGEMVAIVGDGFVIAGAKVVPVKRGAGALKIPQASAPVLGPGGLVAPAPLTDGDRRSAKERIFEHLGGCGDAGASIPAIVHALGLRVGAVSSALLEMKTAGAIRRVSRGVYASKS